MATESLASAVLDTLTTSIAVLDIDGTVLRLNETWHRGAARGLAILPVAPGGSWLTACDEVSGALPHMGRLATLTRQLLDDTHRHARMEFAHFGPRGQRWLRVQLCSIVGRRGLVVTVDDVTESHDLMEELRHHASHDHVTGLANRLLVTPRLAELVKEPGAARDKTHPAALFFLDMDSFRRINNTFGYRTGDLVLRAAAQRLASALGPTDLLARWGGDEFVVLTGRLTSTDAAALAERLSQTLTEPLEVDGHRIKASASVGMALMAKPPEEARRPGAPSDAPSPPDAVELVQRASEALVRSRAELRRRRARPPVRDHHLRHGPYNHDSEDQNGPDQSGPTP